MLTPLPLVLQGETQKLKSILFHQKEWTLCNLFFKFVVAVVSTII